MVFKHKGRCHCHTPRHKRKTPKALLLCDAVLGLMIGLFSFFLLYMVVLPALGVDLDLSFLINVFFSGLWFVVMLIAVNIGWALYYGCHKSKAGVMLSIMTAMIMVYTYLAN